MNRGMIFLLGFLVLFIAGYLVWNNEDGKSREVRIVAENQAIQHPEGTKLISYEVGRKIIKRWVSSKYTYPISDDEVKKYYDQEFEKKGWEKVPYSYSRPGDMFYAYKKDNLEVVLGSHKENYWTLYMTYLDAKY
ncbi:hypothetical protein SRRS_43670 [Sporomusa rhizae]|uniref:hypothetical protein n=1 Tax=Sporomusa rhizae TaxID=357999 RepID=UPI00352AEC67